MNKKRLIAGALVLLTLVGGLMLAKARGWLQFAGTVKQVDVNLAQPDAWIRSTKLAQLPKDLLKVPIARDVLSEDLVYYYEQNEDKLGLRGSLRRIAYEHELQWEDRLLDNMLDEAAEVALWRDARGSLRYFLVAMTRNNLTKIVQQALTFAANDTQLSLLDSIKVDGDKVELLALKISSSQTYVFAAHGNRVVVVSDPGMVASSDKKVISDAAKVLQQLLSEKDGNQIYRQHFAAKDDVGMNANQSRHSLVLGTEFMSFGYQHFFPGLQALRFDFAANGAWSTSVLFDGPQLAQGNVEDAAIWNAMPMDPAACALLPVDWQMGNKILGPLPSEKVHALLPQFDGPAAICWYAQSTLHTPLLVAHLKKGEKPDPAFLGQLFQWAIKGATDTAHSNKDGSKLWQANVTAPFAWAAGANAAKPAAKNAKKGSTDVGNAYPVALAQQGEFLLFSPDGKLVELGLASIGKRYPNMRDVLPKNASSLAVIVPNKLARMAQNETQEVLATPGEEVFQAAAKEHLWPKLEMLKKYPAYRLALAKSPSKTAREWQQVQWQTLDRK